MHRRFLAHALLLCFGAISLLPASAFGYPGPPPKQSIHGFRKTDPDTGQMLWQFRLKDPLYYRLTEDGTDFYLDFFDQGRLAKFDSRTGRLRWDIAYREPIAISIATDWNDVLSSLSVLESGRSGLLGGELLIDLRDGNIVSRSTPDRPFAQVANLLFRHSECGAHCKQLERINPASGASRWKLPVHLPVSEWVYKLRPEFNEFLLEAAGGTVIDVMNMESCSSTLRSIDADTGEIRAALEAPSGFRWQPTYLRSAFHKAITSDENALIFLDKCSDNSALLAGVSFAKGKILWQHQLRDPLPDRVSPAIFHLPELISLKAGIGFTDGDKLMLAPFDYSRPPVPLWDGSPAFTVAVIGNDEESIALLVKQHTGAEPFPSSAFRVRADGSLPWTYDIPEEFTVDSRWVYKTEAHEILLRAKQYQGEHKDENLLAYKTIALDFRTGKEIAPGRPPQLRTGNDYESERWLAGHPILNAMTDVKAIAYCPLIGARPVLDFHGQQTIPDSSFEDMYWGQQALFLGSSSIDVGILGNSEQYSVPLRAASVEQAATWLKSAEGAKIFRGIESIDKIADPENILLPLAEQASISKPCENYACVGQVIHLQRATEQPVITRLFQRAGTSGWAKVCHKLIRTYRTFSDRQRAELADAGLAGAQSQNRDVRLCAASLLVHANVSSTRTQVSDLAHQANSGLQSGTVEQRVEAIAQNTHLGACARGAWDNSIRLGRELLTLPNAKPPAHTTGFCCKHADLSPAERGVAELLETIAPYQKQDPENLLGYFNEVRTFQAQTGSKPHRDLLERLIRVIHEHPSAQAQHFLVGLAQEDSLDAEVRHQIFALPLRMAPKEILRLIRSPDPRLQRAAAEDAANHPDLASKLALPALRVLIGADGYRWNSRELLNAYGQQALEAVRILLKESSRAQQVKIIEAISQIDDPTQFRAPLVPLAKSKFYHVRTAAEGALALGPRPENLRLRSEAVPPIPSVCPAQ